MSTIRWHRTVKHQLASDKGGGSDHRVAEDRPEGADPSVTLRVYAHVTRRHAAGIADVFAAAADQVDEGQGDDEDAPEASGLVPC